MPLGQDETMQGLGCGRGCAGAAGPRYQWVQGVDGLGNTVGYWRPTQPLMPGAPYARNAAPFFGEIAQAADGNLYQWVQGVDGLGQSIRLLEEAQAPREAGPAPRAEDCAVCARRGRGTHGGNAVPETGRRRGTG